MGDVIQLPGQHGPASPLADLAGRPRGRERMQAILDARDPGGLVRELPVQDLYLLLKEVGLEDASEIVELTTPEQFQGLVDLDCWEGDRQAPELLRPWLSALIEAGPDRVAEVWRALDPELAALIIQRWTRIYNLAEEEVPDDEEPPFFPTPDRFFMVKITAEDDEDVRLVERTLDWLYRGDMVLARHILRTAASEPIAELEEMSYRFRSGRLADMGFAPFEEALEVYAPIDPAKVVIGERSQEAVVPNSHLPATMARPALDSHFLGRVLRRITDPAEAGRLESALVMVFNRVLAADRVAPGDTTAAITGAARAAATLSLGLETLARGDEARGVDALASVSLTKLHRLGHTVALQLGRLVGALGSRAERLEEPMATIANAVRGQRPAFPRLLDEPPAPGTRPFTSSADLRRAVDALTRLAAETVLVYDVLGDDPAKRGPAVTLGDLGRTAVARALLGEPAAPRPLRLPDVVGLAKVLPGGTPSPEALQRVHDAIAARAQASGHALPPHWQAVVDEWLARLGRGVAQRGDQVVLDRAFVEGLLLE